MFVLFHVVLLYWWLASYHDLVCNELIKCLNVKTLSNEFASLFSLAYNFIYFFIFIFWDILSLFCPWDAVIQAVLQSDREMEISEATKGIGLRGKLNKVVLAYSGGLDTSVIVPWLRYVYCYMFCSSLFCGLEHSPNYISTVQVFRVLQF